MTPLEKVRLKYRPRVPARLRELGDASCEAAQSRSVLPEIQALFPKTHSAKTQRIVRARSKPAQRAMNVGAIFSGGPAPGGHNVLAGLFDALQEMGQGSTLLGFLDGPAGLIKNRSKLLDQKAIDSVRNLGGFDLIGSGRDKIEEPEQLVAAANAVRAHGLDALVIIGGDDSNTNAAVLAEYFLTQGISTRVLGVPKTIDGDLRAPEIELSFGFDSACKTYAELIGNIARDAASAKKYYHFIKLMGRSASHITLECALATHPNVALIGEERRSLDEIVQHIVSVIERRAKVGKEYGVILIPEGLIEFLPEGSLPKQIAEKLGATDAHGNVMVSQIPTEKLLLEQVRGALEARKFAGKFNAQDHFLGYEGRCCFPSNFDANFAYTLGRSAALGIREGLTGVIVGVQGLMRPAEEWDVAFVPIVQLMRLEVRKGKKKPVIQKALVDVKGRAFVEFAKRRAAWEMEDSYESPGPMQFAGEPELVDRGPVSLCHQGACSLTLLD